MSYKLVWFCACFRISGNFGIHVVLAQWSRVLSLESTTSVWQIAFKCHQVSDFFSTAWLITPFARQNVSPCVCDISINSPLMKDRGLTSMTPLACLDGHGECVQNRGTQIDCDQMLHLQWSLNASVHETSHATSVVYLQLKAGSCYFFHKRWCLLPPLAMVIC